MAIKLNKQLRGYRKRKVYLLILTPNLFMFFTEFIVVVKMDRCSDCEVTKLFFLVFIKALVLLYCFKLMHTVLELVMPPSLGGAMGKA